MNGLIVGFGHQGSMLLMAVCCGFGMAALGWFFFRDQPEDCGLEMDGRKTSHVLNTMLTAEKEIPPGEVVCTYNFWIFCLGMCSSSLLVTGFTFHVSSIGALAGLSRMDAYAVFLPMSIVSVISHFIAGWASDRMPLKYLLMMMVGCLAIGCLGLLHYQEYWSRGLVIVGFGIQGGIWGCLSIVAWPRFYGRKHLGSINGIFMGATVFASAIGPPVFGFSENLNGTYDTTVWISVFLNLFLLFGAARAKSHFRLMPSLNIH